MKRVPVLDFARFASIFVVMGGHFFPHWIASGYPPLLQKMIVTTFLNGTYGVTCFFVVSGFLITQMLAGPGEDLSRIDLKAFYVKRAARIFPLLFLFVLAGLALEGLRPFFDERLQRYDVWNIDSGFGWGFWSSLLTFNFNWFVVAKDGVGIGTHWVLLWSLAIEEQFYFFYPLALKSLKKRRRAVPFLAGVVLAAVLFRCLAFFCWKADPRFLQESSPGAFDQIAMGGILYFLRERFRGQLDRRPGVSRLLFLSGAALGLATYYGTSVDNAGEAVLVPTFLAAACALTLLGGLHLPVFRSTWSSVLSSPGKLSYGFYLWHPTITFLLLPLLVRIGGLGALAFLTAGVWAFCALCYKYFEVPVNDRVRSFFGLKPSRSL
jgi:peptidoglycan/LPS O-acetylase OafA/YrhL